MNDVRSVSMAQFKGAFETINRQQKLVELDDQGNVIPLHEETKFMFVDWLGQDLDAYLFAYDPQDIAPGLSDSAAREQRRQVRDLNPEGAAFFQTSTPSRIMRVNSEKPLTEELAGLLTMLYFKAQGYIVQRPLKSYGGVDDVIAWKSPILDSLRGHGYVTNGCYAPWLSQLRKLGKSERRTPRSSPTAHEILLVEAESSLANAITNDGGMNQLLGKDWKDSTPQRYTVGAKSAYVANRLFITFPVHFPVRFPPVETFDQVVTLVHESTIGPKCGVLCWEPSTLFAYWGDVFDSQDLEKEILEYENYARKLLLENFDFEELLLLVRTMKIDTAQKTWGDVYRELETMADVDIVLEQLDYIVERSS